MTADAIGGVWQYALDLAARLIASGDRVTVMLFGPAPSDTQRADAVRITGLRVADTGLPLDWLSDGPAPVLEAGRALAQMVRVEGADILHCNTPALIGAARFACPVVAVTHRCVSTW